MVLTSLSKIRTIKPRPERLKSKVDLFEHENVRISALFGYQRSDFGSPLYSYSLKYVLTSPHFGHSQMDNPICLKSVQKHGLWVFLANNQDCFIIKVQLSAEIQTAICPHFEHYFITNGLV